MKTFVDLLTKKESEYDVVDDNFEPCEPLMVDALNKILLKVYLSGGAR